jgi:hypothetical protein
MKYETRKVSLIIVIILLVSTMAFYMPKTLASNAVVTTSPNPVEKTESDINSNFDLSINVINVTNLYGFDLNITWSNALISYVSYDKSSLDDVIWPGGYFVANQTSGVGSNGQGYFDFAVASMSTAFSGSNELYKVKFKVKGPFCNSVKSTAIHFALHKLSDSMPAPITHTVVDGLYEIKGNTPTIGFSPTTQTCAKRKQSFDATLGLSGAENVVGFDFEVHFNHTLLDCLSATIDGPWTGPVYSINQTGGKVTGSASSSTGQNGTVTLVIIHFNSSATFGHIWKDTSIEGWINNVVDSNAIYVQSADLMYNAAPTLSYVKGGSSNGITVNPDHLSFTFSPMKGDLNNDGRISIVDLTTICHCYGYKPGFHWDIGLQYDLIKFNDEDIIDIFDIIIITSNYTGT